MLSDLTTTEEAPHTAKTLTKRVPRQLLERKEKKIKKERKRKRKEKSVSQHQEQVKVVCVCENEPQDQPQAVSSENVKTSREKGGGE